MFGAGGNDRPLVDADAFLRTLGMYAAAQTELASLDDTTRSELQAYADGINAFVSSHKGSLPLEFTVLGITPDPWNPIDSLAYGRVVAYSLDGTWNTKYTRAIVTAKTNYRDRAHALPPLSDREPDTDPNTTWGFRQRARSGAAAGDCAQHGGCRLTPRRCRRWRNSRQLSCTARMWSVICSAMFTMGWAATTGSWMAQSQPLVSHCSPTIRIWAFACPPIWYEIGLRGGGLDVIGFSFPGDPGVVIGHNNYIAWGVTNVDADNTDLYLEKLDPDRPSRDVSVSTASGCRLRHARRSSRYAARRR